MTRVLACSLHVRATKGSVSDPGFGAALRMALRCLGTHNAVSYLVAAHANPEHLADRKAAAIGMALHDLGTHTAVHYLVAAHEDPQHLADLKAPAMKLVVEHGAMSARLAWKGGWGAQLLVAHPELMSEVTGLIHSRLREALKRKRESGGV